MEKLVPVMAIAICAVAAFYAVLCYAYWKKVHSDTEWRNNLNAESLRTMEKQVEEASAENHVLLGKKMDLEQVKKLIGKKYEIKERWIMPFREAYTSPEDRTVYVQKGLSPEKYYFALTHELMHIWFDVCDESAETRYRDVHSIFRRRTKEEQDTDYRAACLIMNEKVFVEDLNKAEYFLSSEDKRRETIYALSSQYKVTPDAVAKRICEINKLYNESEANRIH